LPKCSGITQAGTACKGIPIEGSQWCYAHHPDRTEERRRHGSKGGKRGGRGRPSPATGELVRLQGRFEDLAGKVLSGEVERGNGAVAAQLLNGARACVLGLLKAREQEEILGRVLELERRLSVNQRNHNQKGRKAWCLAYGRRSGGSWKQPAALATSAPLRMGWRRRQPYLRADMDRPGWVR
jgi:hypothetical protein